MSGKVGVLAMSHDQTGPAQQKIEMQTPKHTLARNRVATLGRIDGSGVQKPRSSRSAATAENGHVLNEASFEDMIAFERKRSERSGRVYALILVGTRDNVPRSNRETLLGKIGQVLIALTRDTDVTGWYKTDSTLGVIFADIVAADKDAVVAAILARVTDTLSENLTPEQLSHISISTNCYPENWQGETSQPSNPALYPDLASRDRSRRVAIVIKRIMDIIGSIVAIVLFAPVILIIAIAIKLTSKGPVFFRQERIGQHGKPFVLLKFRSMYINNDTEVHKLWFESFYTGNAKRHNTGDDNGNGTFKLPNDPRVTRFGRLLRRTSMDEVPQFFNVLKGEMSLVGPRPPIRYEVNAYKAWHRGRILQAKPGITGLWQVNGRSRVAFDEMVRLDLRYARTWSIWLDIQILLKTPAAVFFGEGAY
jgi:exopolysaccharide biosynthesis polyprenyl glycosylphosphotransferase